MQFDSETRSFAGPAANSSSRAPSRPQPNRFLDHMQQLFGDDPDPVFLAESWAVGVTAATENLHQRRNRQAEHEYHSRAIEELYRMAHLDAGFPTGQPESQAAVSDAPYADLNRNFSLDVAFPSHDVAFPFTDVAFPFTDASFPFPTEPVIPKPRPKPNLDFPTYSALNTPTARAYRLLGVAPDATHDEVRSAYRRQVSLCHPDRQAAASEAVRRRATEQMAELNQAYHLLSTTSFADAA